MSSRDGAGPKPVAQAGKTSSAKFAEIEAQHKATMPSMSMNERALLGLPYLASDDALTQARLKARRLYREYNLSEPGPADAKEEGANDISNANRRRIMGALFGIEEAQARRVFIEPPFFCDYGYNIKFEGSFYANSSATILDCAEVRFGDGVLMGPNVHIYSATHSISVAEREQGYERALPVSIGRNTWIGGNCAIMAGVNIGEGCTIGAGSIVTRDIPKFTVAVGNPARIVKVLSEEEKGRRDGKSNMVPF